MRNFILRTILFFLLIGMVSSVNGQIFPYLNQQLYHAELYNSSAMGLEATPQIYLNQRTDYLGDQVSPLTFLVGGNGPALLNGKLVLGGQLGVRIQKNNINFKILETESTLRAAFPLLDSESHKFALGVSTSVSTVKTNYEYFFGVEEKSSSSRFDLGMGASYQFTKEKFGLKLEASLVSLPIVYFHVDGLSDTKNSSFFTSASVSYSFGDVKVEPIVLVRTFFRENANNNTVLDFGTRVHYKDIVWIGGGSKTKKYGGHIELGFIPGGILQNQLEFFGSANITSYSNVSLEFGLGYTFGNKTKSE